MIPNWRWSGATDKLEGRGAIQRDLGTLQSRVCVNLSSTRPGVRSCTWAGAMPRTNTCKHQHPSLDGQYVQNSAEENKLGILVDEN